MKYSIPGLLLLLFLFLQIQVAALTINLTEDAEISLLTASPGDELYSVFGHSALRVYDPNNSIDLVFNYGTFDFDTPNFYLQFVRGKLLYKLSVAPMEYFIAEYKFAGRAVFEQVLNLDQNTKQRMFEFLLWNQHPENAYYLYDFFYDNCATRIRDLADVFLSPVWQNSPEEIVKELPAVRSLFNFEFDYQPVITPDRTLRDLLQPYLKTMPWIKFGIDLALGLPADVRASNTTSMYLPDEMLIAFALAKRADGSPLVAESRVLFPKTVALSPAGRIKPWMITTLVLFLSIFSLLKKKWSEIFDRVYYSFLGITGLVILFLWIFADHLTTKSNLNLLWAIPTHLYFVWFTGNIGKTGIKKLYFTLTLFIGIVLLLGWWLLPQGLNLAFIPLIIASVIKSIPRSFVGLYYNKKPDLT